MSEPTSLEPRMLERRVSNNRADMSNDQQMNFLLAWFNQWSDLEKDDFVSVLGDTMSSKHLNGMTDSFSSLQFGQVDKRRPSLFDCQVSLYRSWVNGWSDDQKNYLILRLKDIDSIFAKKYENFISYGTDSPEKDYFEPGIPSELDLSCGSLNTSVDEERGEVGRAVDAEEVREVEVELEDLEKNALVDDVSQDGNEKEVEEERQNDLLSPIAEEA